MLARELDFLDGQYREAEQPLAPLIAQIGRRSSGAHVYAPAIGDHVDHRSYARPRSSCGKAASRVAVRDLPTRNQHAARGQLASPGGV